MRANERKLPRKLRLAALSVACAGVLLLCAACAPQAGNVGEGSSGTMADTGDGTAVEWSLDADCATCHTDQQASMENTAQPASNHAAVGCATCHNDEAAMAKSHDGKTADSKMPKKLKRSKIDETACASCHSAEDLKAATADLTVLTDGNGTTVNPHDIPANSGHEGQIDCSSCHTMHGEADVQAAAQEKCASCHHKDVYECGTCHE